MQRIFLIGFMGSGKSTVGKQLSDMMHYAFVDLDDVIEQREQTTIAKIFTEKGEAFFRKLESEVLQSFSFDDNAVIACGGGAPCFNNNMAWMNAHGKTVYLKLSSQHLFERLKNEAAQRPLLEGKKDAALLHFIEDKLKEREKFYSEAELVVDCDGLSAEEIAEKISAQVK